MADASTWTRAHPSGASLLRDFDDLHRSDKSIFEASFLEEHYWKDGSAASAGEHKLGSARIYSGASSEVSASGQSGRLMWDHTNAQLVALHAATTTRIPSLVANNTWSGTQTFSAAVTCSSTLAVTGMSTLSGGITSQTSAPDAVSTLTMGQTGFVTGADNQALARWDVNNPDSSWGAGIVTRIESRSGAVGDGSGGLLVFSTALAGTTRALTERGRMTDGGVFAWGTTVIADAVTGDLVIAHGKSLRSVGSGGTVSYPMINMTTSSAVQVGWNVNASNYGIKLAATSPLSLESVMTLLFNIGGTFTAAIVKCGAAGTGPGGTGRALYI
jgi:hypothetical protein